MPSAACNELQQIASKLMREIGDKQRELMMTPKPDRGDRG